MNNLGTPKSIMQAIDNACAEFNKSDASILAPYMCNELIASHVRDFLRQKIGAIMLSDNPDVVAVAKKLQEELGI